MIINANDLIDVLNEDDIIKLMRELGSDDFKEFGEGYIFRSVCHDSDSYKLHYYIHSKRFYCFRCAKQMSVYDLIIKVNNCEFKDAFRLLKNIVNGYNRTIIGFGINTRKQASLDEIIAEPLPQVKKKYLYEVFKNKPIKEWEKDNINYKATKKFKIRKDDVKNRIIIPHFNINNELIGIRVRHLNPIDMQTKGKYIPLFYDGIGYNFPISQNLYGLNVSKENIKKYKKCVIGESEKFVMQYESYYPDNNLAVSMCGSNLSGTQKKMLIEIGVQEIVLCLDRQYEKEDSEEAEIWRNKIYKMTEDLLPYCRVSYTWDKDDNQLLEYKDAPTDVNKNVFEYLIQHRVFIN